MFSGTGFAQSGQEILSDFNAAYNAKQWDRAAELGLKLFLFDSRNATHAYNLACVYALKGDKDDAIKWLRTSVERGFADSAHVRIDADLVSLRTLPAFEAILKSMDERLAVLMKNAAKADPLIVVPPNLDKQKAAPLIVALHPFGSRPQWIVDHWRTVAAEAGAIMVAPQALNPQGGGFQWGAVQEADFVLEHALEVVMKKHKIDAKRVVLTGFSQGGYMAFNLGMKHADIFCGVIPSAGNYNPVLAAPPTSDPTKLPKFYIMAGDQDGVIGSNRVALQEYEAAGVQVKLAVYPGVGHAYPPNRDEELRKALKFVFQD